MLALSPSLFTLFTFLCHHRCSEVNTSYNRVAGRSLERLAALSDGIFAVDFWLLIFVCPTPKPFIARESFSMPLD
jgi:hypothetical protein